jgi:hypothetical protein
MRCAGGKSPASVKIISALSDGVVLIQRRVSQSARVISDNRFVMARIVGLAPGADYWTFVQWYAVDKVG